MLCIRSQCKFRSDWQKEYLQLYLNNVFFGEICCNWKLVNYEGSSSPEDRESTNIGMPLLKGRSRSVKVDPTFQGNKGSTLPDKDLSRVVENGVLRGNMPPYLSTLKFHLRDLNDGEAIRQCDYLEEGVEYTSLPVHKTRGAQTITLPMNMPIVESESCFRRKGDDSPLLKDRVTSSCVNGSKVSLWSHKVRQENSACQSTETLSDIRPAVGKWFNDIDKLTSFKAKHKLEIFSMEKRETIKEWTSSPKHFYKCILKCRQKQLVCNGYRGSAKCEASSCEVPKKVGFSAEVLLFSAIEENSSSELTEVIRTHKIDVNLYKNARGLPPLHRAVQRGAIDCVRVLLNHSADVNLRDSKNRPAINMALAGRQFECTVLLIESGASIEEYTKQRLQEYEDVQALSKSCYRSFEANV